MGQYEKLFVLHEMYERNTLFGLNEEELVAIGVTNSEHRKVFLEAIERLKESHERDDEDMKLSMTEYSDEIVKSKGSNRTLKSAEEQLEEFKQVVKHEDRIIKEAHLEYLEELGHGSFATVYKGRYNGREVAIKVMKQVDENTAEIEAIRKECQVMSNIESPYVVFFFGVCLHPKLCIVMEYMGKGSLYNLLIDNRFVVSWERVFTWCLDMMKGLNYLHSLVPPILHRDIKSMNLMVSDLYRVKLGDFGLSRFDITAQEVTLKKLVGTMAFAAPETFDHNRRFDAKADIFSSGLTVWEIVYRCIKRKYQRPYQEYPFITSPVAIIHQVATQQLRPTIPVACPSQLTAFIRRLWDNNPDLRPTALQSIKILETLEEAFKQDPQAWNSAISSSVDE
jgi:serine/threonine protein kinase